jgi:hypothetical protein
MTRVVSNSAVLHGSAVRRLSLVDFTGSGGARPDGGRALPLAISRSKIRASIVEIHRKFAAIVSATDLPPGPLARTCSTSASNRSPARLGCRPTSDAKGVMASRGRAVHGRVHATRDHRRRRRVIPA